MQSSFSDEHLLWLKSAIAPVKARQKLLESPAEGVALSLNHLNTDFRPLYSDPVGWVPG